jgi:hypothetical protein
MRQPESPRARSWLPLLIQINSADGTPSYVELLTGLEVVREAKK